MGRGTDSPQAGRTPGTPSPRNKKLQSDVEATHGEEGPVTVREAKILRAAIEELAGSDYGGLSFERVAARAGVNKTTVYRHWETKADLVRSALTLCLRSVSPEISTGALRDDLIRVGRRMVEFASSFEGQSLLRLHLLQHPEPELANIAKELHAKHLAQLAALGEAAAARGELREGADFTLMLDMLGGTLHARLVIKNEPVDDVLIARIVDVLLRGGSVPRDRPRKRASSGARSGGR